jgi:hypothetical protein
MAKTVFLSSVYHELIDYRREGFAAIRDAGQAPAGMEIFDPNDVPPQTNDDERVRASDVFVLLVGWRYGMLSPNGISFTELEFNAALASSIKILPFYLSGNAQSNPPTPDEEQFDQNYQRDARKAFLARLRVGMTPVPVDSPEDFRRRLSLALLRLERDPISIPAAKINRMLPRLCDRVPQLNDFQQFPECGSVRLPLCAIRL